jgi:hypothetical protein
MSTSASNQPFSLTLTLSRWERGQQSARLTFAEMPSANPVAHLDGQRPMILPLPAGEGRGEGERNANPQALENRKAPLEV